MKTNKVKTAGIYRKYEKNLSSRPFVGYLPYGIPLGRHQLFPQALEHIAEMILSQIAVYPDKLFLKKKLKANGFQMF